MNKIEMPVVLLPIPWRECLEDTALLLAQGAPMPVPSVAAFTPTLVLGAHAMPDVTLHKDSVIFNTEHPSTWSCEYRALMAKHRVLHYSSEISGVHCPLAYSENFPTITLNDDRDIDVLHFGSMTPRRAQILKGCTDLGLKVCSVFGVFGEELKALIARTKVVLNVHYYTDPPCFEYARVVPPLHSGVCVLSENSPEAEDLVTMCSYGSLANRAMVIVRGDLYRRYGQEDLKALKARPTMRETLKDALNILGATK